VFIDTIALMNTPTTRLSSCVAQNYFEHRVVGDIPVQKWKLLVAKQGKKSKHL